MNRIAPQMRILLAPLCLFLFAACSATPPPFTPAPPTAAPAQAPTAGAPAAPTVSASSASIKVVTLPYIAFAPFWIAQDEGYFREQGLNVELVDMTEQPDSTAAFLSGQADVTSGQTSASYINALAKGAELAIVADKGYADPNNCNNIALIARKGLFDAGEPTPDQLKGKNLNVVRGTWNQYFLDKLLTTVGMQEQDFVTGNIPSPSQPDAMAQGTIDLTIQNEPWVTRLLDAGNRSLWTPVNQIMPNSTTGVTVFGPRLLGANADVGKRFMVAYLKAVRAYNQGKTDRNVEILSKYSKLDPELLKRVCWPALRGDGMVNLDSLIDFQKWAQNAGIVSDPIAPDKLFDPTFVEYANQQLGPVTQ